MKIISQDNTFLTETTKKSYLSASASAAGTTITVDSIKGFAINQVLLIGELGNETTEIIHTHASTTPTGNTVTLASALTFAHPQGTAVHIVQWNQVVVSHAETVTGSKEVLATINIQPDQLETIYTDSTKSEGFYFTRLYNSITSVNSVFSDPVPVEGYSSNRVGSIVEYALFRNKLEGFTKFVSYDFCIEEINSCLKYIKGKLKKWSKLQDFDHDLGQAIRGRYYLALPTTVWNSSYKAILDVRCSGGSALEYKTKKKFNDLMTGVARTTATAAVAGDTSFEITDATHFYDDGIVMVNGNLITYTGKTSNTLTGVPASGTGAITETITAGDNVWQGSYEEGSPEYYTVYNSNLYWWPMTSSATPTQNIVVDFWTEAPEIDSDYDEIDIYRYDMVKYWLTWAIRMQVKNDGIREFNDGDYMQFELMLRDAIKGEITGQKKKIAPKLNRIIYRHI